MEIISKEQTLEQILNNFKKFKDSNYNLEEYTPSFFEDTIRLFQDDIEKLECLSSSETSNSIFINKLTFKNKNIRNIDDFRKFILENKPNIQNITPYKDFEDRLRSAYNCIKTDIGGKCVEIFYFDSKNNVYPSTKLIIGNAYRNPFDTMQTIFHEFCHAIQSKYDGRKYSYLWKAILEREKYSKFEYNKILGDYYINHLFTTETEADLFSFFILLIKSINTNNYDIILDTLRQIEKILFRQKQFSVFRGYFSYPILKDFLYNREKLEELKRFIYKNGEIDILKLREFTKEITLKKHQEYCKDLFNNDNVNYDLFDTVIRKNEKSEKIDDFIKQNVNAQFVKDYLEYRNAVNQYVMDDNTLLENKILDLTYKILHFERILK